MLYYILKSLMKSYPAQLNKISIFSTSFAKSKMDALLVTSKHLADMFFSNPLRKRSDPLHLLETCTNIFVLFLELEKIHTTNLF